MQRVAIDGIAVLSRFGHLARWTFGDRPRSRSEITSVSQRIELHAEYRAGRETGRGNALSCYGSSAGHLNSPRDRLPIASPHRLRIRSERHEMDLGMIRLSNKSGQYSRQCDGFGLVVHRERVM